MSGLLICFFVVLYLFLSCVWIFTRDMLKEASPDILNLRSEMLMHQLMGIPEALKTCTNLLLQRPSTVYIVKMGRYKVLKTCKETFSVLHILDVYAAGIPWTTCLWILT